MKELMKSRMESKMNGKMNGKMKKKMGGMSGMAALILGILMAMTTGLSAAEPVQCMLDWYPNPNHVPLYVAQEEGYFENENIKIDLMVPADPNDPLKLVAAGKIPFAISYQPSVIMARAQQLPVVSIGALVQHPLSTILFLANSDIKTPADFKGKKIGYSVAPLYNTLFDAVAQKAGLLPKDYELFSVGFNLSPPLLTGQVDAVIGAFRNYEAIQIELEGKPVGIFPLEENGIPDFYELVLITSEDYLKKAPETVAGFMKAITRGIEKTINHPKKAFKIFLSQHQDLRDDLNKKSFAATLPFFKNSPDQTIQRWETLQNFMLEHKLIEKATPVKEMVWMPEK